MEIIFRGEAIKYWILHQKKTLQKTCNLMAMHMVDVRPSELPKRAPHVPTGTGTAHANHACLAEYSNNSASLWQQSNSSCQQPRPHWQRTQDARVYLGFLYLSTTAWALPET